MKAKFVFENTDDKLTPKKENLNNLFKGKTKEELYNNFNKGIRSRYRSGGKDWGVEVKIGGIITGFDKFNTNFNVPIIEVFKNTGDKVIPFTNFTKQSRSKKGWALVNTINNEYYSVSFSHYDVLLKSWIYNPVGGMIIDRNSELLFVRKEMEGIYSPNDDINNFYSPYFIIKDSIWNDSIKFNSEGKLVPNF